MASNSTSERTIATIINSVRAAARAERHNPLMNETRTAFRPGLNVSRSRGRKSSNTWKKQIYLLRRCNADFYPSFTECSYLQEHGLGTDFLNYMYFKRRILLVAYCILLYSGFRFNFFFC